jgi:putative lipoprotein
LRKATHFGYNACSAMKEAKDMTEEKANIPEEVEETLEPLADADEEAVAALEGEEIGEEAAPAEVEFDSEKRTDWSTIVVGVIGVVLLLCLVAACVAAAFAVFSGGGSASVTGNVFYRERMALTEDAVVTVQVQDVSLADAPAKVIGEQVIENPGQVPISFEVEYDERDIDERHTYSVYARIEDGQGDLLFTTTQSYPVITHGNPTENVEVLVQRVSGSAPEPDPQPTPAPAEPSIKINEPDRADVLDISKSVTVQGTGANLHEGNVVVQAVDLQGNVLDEQPTTLSGRDVGTGGERSWSVELNIEVVPGTPGKIFAFSPSPKDGSIMASDQVDVTYGQSPAVDSFIKIEEPESGTVLDIDKSIAVNGSGGGLFEGNVVIRVLDASGNVLTEQATVLQGDDVGVGGPGTWSIQIRVEVEPGTPGMIYAFSPSPKDGSIMASDEVEVVFGEEPSTEAYIKIAEPAAGASLDVSQPIQVSGTGAGLHEGNLVVLALDEQGNVLAQRPTTLVGDDVGTGGEGTWSTELTVDAAGNGYIAAVSTLPTAQQQVAASDHIQVTFEQDLGLEGVNWVLARTIPGTEITAVFDGGQISGSAGCNNYFGTYVTSSSRGRNTISISELGTTMMMCAEEIAEQEQEYLAALQSATNYSIDGTTLEITSPDTRLVYGSK